MRKIGPTLYIMFWTILAIIGLGLMLKRCDFASRCRASGGHPVEGSEPFSTGECVKEKP